MYTAHRIRERLKRLVKTGLFPKELEVLEKKASDRELLLILETTFFLLTTDEIRKLIEAVGTPKFEDVLQEISERRAILDTAGENLQYSMLVFLDKLSRYTSNLPTLQVTERAVNKLDFLCMAFLGASLNMFVDYLTKLQSKMHNESKEAVRAEEMFDKAFKQAQKVVKTIESYLDDFKSQLDNLQEAKKVADVESIDFFD